MTEENLDTILDCPEEEDYESKHRSTRILLDNQNESRNMKQYACDEDINSHSTKICLNKM